MSSPSLKINPLPVVSPKPLLFPSTPQPSPSLPKINPVPPPNILPSLLAPALQVPAVPGLNKPEPESSVAPIDPPDPNKYTKNDKPCYYVTKNGAGSACVCKTVNYLGLCRDHYPVVKRNEEKQRQSHQDDQPVTAPSSDIKLIVPGVKANKFPSINKNMDSSSDYSDYSGSDIENYINGYKAKSKSKSKSKSNSKEDKPLNLFAKIDNPNSDSESEQDVFDTEDESESDSQSFVGSPPSDVSFELIAVVGYDMYLAFISYIETQFVIPGLLDEVSSNKSLQELFPLFLKDCFKFFGIDYTKLSPGIMFIGLNIFTISRAKLRSTPKAPGIHY